MWKVHFGEEFGVKLYPGPSKGCQKEADDRRWDAGESGAEVQEAKYKLHLEA